MTPRMIVWTVILVVVTMAVVNRVQALKDIVNA